MIAEKRKLFFLAASLQEQWVFSLSHQLSVRLSPF